MKKVLIFLLVIGILTIGTCVIDGILEESSECTDFSDEPSLDNDDPAPCGDGHGGDGGGPIPG